MDPVMEGTPKSKRQMGGTCDHGGQIRQIRRCKTPGPHTQDPSHASGSRAEKEERTFERGWKEEGEAGRRPGTTAVKLICLRSYSHGYMGFVEDEHSYMYFNFPRKGRFKPLMTFNKGDYADYGHFVGGITKFFPYNFFLRNPVVMESCTIEELDRIADSMSESQGADLLQV